MPVRSRHRLSSKRSACSGHYHTRRSHAWRVWAGRGRVTPEFGPRVRLVTVLTDLPLMPDRPVRNRCGTCQECTKACPAGAIRNVRTESHYETREQAVALEKCHALVKTFAERPGIGARICGVCVRACPWGKKKR